MKTHTRQSVHDLLQSRWESDTPDRILQALAPFAGKPITTRIEKALGTIGGTPWKVVRHFGWTEITNDAYRHTQGSGKDGVCLMLARSEASVPLDLAWVEAENTAFFAGRRERNHARMEAMNTAATLDQAAAALNAVERAIEALHAATERLQALSEYGTTLHPDCYELERACRLSDARGQRLVNQDYRNQGAV